MLAVKVENAAPVDYAGAVHLEPNHGRPARWCPAEDHLEIFAPIKMVFPLPAARVVERNNLTASRVQPLRAGELVVVAGLAGKCQVVQSVRPAVMTGENMFRRKRTWREIRTAEAVFTASARAQRRPVSAAASASAQSYECCGMPSACICASSDVPRRRASCKTPSNRCA